MIQEHVRDFFYECFESLQFLSWGQFLIEECEVKVCKEEIRDELLILESVSPVWLLCWVGREPAMFSMGSQRNRDKTLRYYHQTSLVNILSFHKCKFMEEISPDKQLRLAEHVSKGSLLNSSWNTLQREKIVI